MNRKLQTKKLYLWHVRHSPKNWCAVFVYNPKNELYWGSVVCTIQRICFVLVCYLLFVLQELDCTGALSLKNSSLLISLHTFTEHFFVKEKSNWSSDFSHAVVVRGAEIEWLTGVGFLKVLFKVK